MTKKENHKALDVSKKILDLLEGEYPSLSDVDSPKRRKLIVQRLAALGYAIAMCMACNFSEDAETLEMICKFIKTANSDFIEAAKEMQRQARVN